MMFDDGNEYNAINNNNHDINDDNNNNDANISN